MNDHLVFFIESRQSSVLVPILAEVVFACLDTFCLLHRRGSTSLRQQNWLQLIVLLDIASLEPRRVHLQILQAELSRFLVLQGFEFSGDNVFIIMLAVFASMAVLIATVCMRMLAFSATQAVTLVARRIRLFDRDSVPLGHQEGGYLLVGRGLIEGWLAVFARTRRLAKWIDRCFAGRLRIRVTLFPPNLFQLHLERWARGALWRFLH